MCLIFCDEQGGLKRVLLFPPDQWKHLYPWPPTDMSGKTSWAFSQVSGVVLPDLAKFPLMAHAVILCYFVLLFSLLSLGQMRERAEAVLRPGELLFIPAGWAHEVSGEPLPGSDHVASVNRFYFTPMQRGTWYLDESVKQMMANRLGGTVTK